MGRFDKTLEFIARLQNAQTVKTVNATLLSLIQPFGLDYCIAAIIPQTGRLPTSRRRLQSHILFSSWPSEWQTQYERARYIQRDPLVKRFQCAPAPFRWSDESVRALINDDLGAATLMDEARDHGLKDGLGFVVDTLDGRRVAVSFAGENADLSPAERSVLNLISVYAVGKAMEILDGKNRVAFGLLGLTLREVECLNWASHGKSEWEIGQILAISEHTAEKHLASAKVKLRAATRAQAVSEAMRLGLIR
ncbi:helix-turn-helix transcriptional regulator [Limoniibacter endophyticus]|uniref:LuxR family transcriptional regulator n=1 Tax=Limoniibacter endophyticus TaxID=1565040 RepID=A0A8J3DLG2_9HYPH|nr:LuxR family transcriptional regulator [Limoniibacter endophyticus]GHC80327.1 LuxR family transcriptional regulator [Limoniibacter endophyticus]